MARLRWRVEVTIMAPASWGWRYELITKAGPRNQAWRPLTPARRHELPSPDETGRPRGKMPLVDEGTNAFQLCPVKVPPHGSWLEVPERRRISGPCRKRRGARAR